MYIYPKAYRHESRLSFARYSSCYWYVLDVNFDAVRPFHANIDNVHAKPQKTTNTRHTVMAKQNDSVPKTILHAIESMRPYPLNRNPLTTITP